MAVDSCQRLAAVWPRVAACHSPDDQQLRAQLLSAAARAQASLSTILSSHNHATSNHGSQPNGHDGSLAAALASVTSHGDSKDPAVVAMMQKYTDLLVSMVQHKMQSHPSPR